MSRRSTERSGLLAVALAAAIGMTLAPRLAWAQDQSLVPAQVQSQVPAATQPAAPQPNQDNATQADGNCPGHPGALGTSRVLPLDPAQYPRVGHMQYPDTLPLNDKEVVLTFDDGPVPRYSNEILDILASQCVKATYFMVGEMARAYPAVVRRVYEEGHTIGTKLAPVIANWQQALVRDPDPIRSATSRAGSSGTPILFGLALYRWRFWIFDLHPMRRAPRPIHRAKPL